MSILIVTFRRVCVEYHLLSAVSYLSVLVSNSRDLASLELSLALAWICSWTLNGRYLYWDRSLYCSFSNEYLITNPSSHQTIRGDCGEFSCSPTDAFCLMVLAAHNETVPLFSLYGLCSSFFGRRGVKRNVLRFALLELPLCSRCESVPFTINGLFLLCCCQFPNEYSDRNVKLTWFS